MLFFLVFAFKRRESDEPARIHNCQNCNCEKKESGHLERFRRQARGDGGTGPLSGAVPGQKEAGESSLTRSR